MAEQPADEHQVLASGHGPLDRCGLPGQADGPPDLVGFLDGVDARNREGALVGAPELLLLDEPTTGLDPRSRNDLWDAIRSLVAAGTGVLLTTQYLDEADQLAARIAIIDHGKVIAEGTPDDLKSKAGNDVVEVHVADPAELERAIGALTPLGTEAPRVDRPTRSIAVPVERGSAQLLEAVRMLDSMGLEVSDIGLRRATLDEVFLALTGRPAESEPDPDAEGPATTDKRRRSRRTAA